MELGAKLKRLRKERGFTQKELAQRAGVSVNAISLIEREEISPSVSTLQNLAGALQVKISYFFSDDTRSNTLLCTNQTRPHITTAGVSIESMGKAILNQQIEPFVLTLEPHTDSGSQPVVHTGHEFIYCIEGSINYQISGQNYTMSPGDMLIFEATQPHIWSNPTDVLAKMLLILQSPEASHHVSRQHFPKHPSLPHIS